MLPATLAGFGFASLPEGMVEAPVARPGPCGSCRIGVRFSGYHLYYPSRPQCILAFAILVDASRYPRVDHRLDGELGHRV